MGRKLGVTGVDWLAFAIAWRAQYQPKMERCEVAPPWTTLDVLHREGLIALTGFGLGEPSEADRDDLTFAWHQLDPWPDVVAGLTRLKTRYIIAPNSNGTSRSWCAWPGAPVCPGTRSWGRKSRKPISRSRRSISKRGGTGACAGEVMMVAAHNNDLARPAACGLQTAFVPRPTEYGPGQTSELSRARVRSGRE